MFWVIIFLINEGLVKQLFSQQGLHDAQEFWVIFSEQFWIFSYNLQKYIL